MVQLKRPLAFTWGLSEAHGWGLLGVHAALYLQELGRPPLLLERPLWSSLRPQNRERLSALQRGYEVMTELAAKNPEQVFLLDEFDVLHALGNGFEAGPASKHFRGRANLGVIAYEDTRFDDAVLQRIRSYDAMIVHSTFNRRLLEERGIANVRLAFQGIDSTEMYPGEPSGRFGDRFVIFSGGKLEFRKGQDIVVAAFRRFHQRHPDALLVTAWHNPWPNTAATMAESALAPAPPRIDAQGRLRIADWAVQNGAPPEAFVDLGFLSRDKIPAILWDAHAAVFPNRCEGATNLVAMEAMACGAPCVLSANTGHLDLTAGDVCFTLDHQEPVVDADGSRVGWGESSVDELVEALERIYVDREESARRRANALRFVHGERTWRKFAEAFAETTQL